MGWNPQGEHEHSTLEEGQDSKALPASVSQQGQPLSEGESSTRVRHLGSAVNTDIQASSHRLGLGVAPDSTWSRAALQCMRVLKIHSTQCKKLYFTVNLPPPADEGGRGSFWQWDTLQRAAESPAFTQTHLTMLSPYGHPHPIPNRRPTSAYAVSSAWQDSLAEMR